MRFFQQVNSSVNATVIGCGQKPHSGNANEPRPEEHARRPTAKGEDGARDLRITARKLAM